MQCSQCQNETVGFVIIWLIAIIKASKGVWYRLPIIGDIALQQVQQGSFATKL